MSDTVRPEILRAACLTLESAVCSLCVAEHPEWPAAWDAAAAAVDPAWPVRSKVGGYPADHPVWAAYNGARRAHAVPVLTAAYDAYDLSLCGQHLIALAAMLRRKE